MVTTQAEIQTLTLAPGDPNADPPVLPMTTATVLLKWPHVGTLTVVVPTAATGGIAVGPCTVSVDQG